MCSSARAREQIGPAPESTDTGQQQAVNVPDYTMTIIGAGTAVIIAVVAHDKR